MKLNILIAPLCVMLLTFPSHAADLTKAQQEKLQIAVKDKLLDPDSARFKLPAYKGGDVYCGLVNSKNRIGGYAGDSIFQAFILKDAPSGFYVLGVGTANPNDPGTSALITSCAEKGYAFK